MALLILYILLTLLSNKYVIDALGCNDMNGKAQKWWFLYKKPRNWDYYYFTERTANPLEIFSMDTNANNPIFQTIKNVWSNQQQMVLFAYNDQIVSDKGTIGEIPNPRHSKGILAIDFSGGDNLSGFWIIHSVPVFPNINISQPANNANLFSKAKQPRNAQSVLCLPLIGKKNIKMVVFQLLAMNNLHYMTHCGTNTDWRDRLPILNDERLCGEMGESQHPDPTFLWINLWKNGGDNSRWYHFAGSMYNGEQLAHEISSVLEQDMIWQTWSTKGKIGTIMVGDGYCNSDVLSIKGEWNSGRDHSKIGISSGANNKQWVCIGDLNRYPTDRPRGGGYACRKIPNLHSILSRWFNTDEKCDGSKPRTSSSPRRKSSARLSSEVFKGTRSKSKMKIK